MVQAIVGNAKRRSPLRVSHRSSSRRTNGTPQGSQAEAVPPTQHLVQHLAPAMPPSPPPDAVSPEADGRQLQGSPMAGQSGETKRAASVPSQSAEGAVGGRSEVARLQQPTGVAAEAPFLSRDARPLGASTKRSAEIIAASTAMLRSLPSKSGAQSLPRIS